MNTSVVSWPCLKWTQVGPLSRFTSQSFIVQYRNYIPCRGGIIEATVNSLIVRVELNDPKYRLPTRFTGSLNLYPNRFLTTELWSKWKVRPWNIMVREEYLAKLILRLGRRRWEVWFREECLLEFINWEYHFEKLMLQVISRCWKVWLCLKRYSIKSRALIKLWKIIPSSNLYFSTWELIYVKFLRRIYDTNPNCLKLFKFMMYTRIRIKKSVHLYLNKSK